MFADYKDYRRQYKSASQKGDLELRDKLRAEWERQETSVKEDKKLLANVWDDKAMQDMLAKDCHEDVRKASFIELTLTATQEVTADKINDFEMPAIEVLGQTEKIRLAQWLLECLCDNCGYEPDDDGMLVKVGTKVPNGTGQQDS